MTYAEAIEFLYNLRLFGTKLGLENTFRLARLCGNPQEKLRFIHVAGTNGKGSTCAMIESIYRHGGYRTGLYTSPHLVSFTERMQVSRTPVDPATVVRLVETLLDRLQEENGTSNRELWVFRPTFFEFVTVMALLYFSEQNCEIVIWETGMGGRLDATNIVNPLLSVITNIQFDHQVWLGDTLEKIAYEKAGIIKPGAPVVTGTTEPEALQVIRSVAKENNSPLVEINQESLEDPFVAKVRLGLKGDHQRWNAAMALATVRILQAKAPVSHEQIITGLEKVHWAGRLQLVHIGATKYLLDGAHNPDGAKTLRTALEKLNHNPFTLVLGLFKDKEWRNMCEMLVPGSARVLLVPVQSERSADPVAVKEYCQGRWPEVLVKSCGSLGAALEESAGSFTVVAGSLHLVGEAMELLGLNAGAPNERALNEWDAAGNHR